MAYANDLWTARVYTIFPEMFPGPLKFSVAGAGLKRSIWTIETVDIRAYSGDKHRTVDGTPYGGGPGMVMRADVIDSALAAANPRTQPVYLTPRGRPLTQKDVRRLAAQEELNILCGRFEGVDERVLEARNFDQVCMGDFIMSGGEPAAIALIDACVRLLPGIMGNKESVLEESFEGGLLEYPQYTRPEVWKGRRVPKHLLSGHHEKINEWRREAAAKTTREQRPDLWALNRDCNMAVKD